jgi:hypothetical protein
VTAFGRLDAAEAARAARVAAKVLARYQLKQVRP